MLSGVWYMVRVTKKNVLDPNFRDRSFHPSKPCSLPPIHQGVGGGITNINPQLQTHRTELEIVSSSSRNSQAKLQTRKPQIDFPTGHTVRLPASKELLGHMEKEKWAPETEVFVLQLFVSSTEQSTKQTLTTCSLSSVCRQGPKPKSRSEILQVSQNTGSRAEHRAQLTEPRGPVTPLPDQEKALVVVTSGFSHNVHILMPSICQSLHQNKGCVWQDKAIAPTQTINSWWGFFLTKRRQKTEWGKLSLSKRRFKSQNETGQSGLRNSHFKMPSDPLYYIPPKGCNTATM